MMIFSNSNHMTRCSEDHVGNNNTEVEDIGEYNGLSYQCQNGEVRPSENIYDRTNNVVSGIYDSTSMQTLINVYTI